ncbi:MAG: translation initiation factor [Bacteroidales bacterium]|nr:translation initiation factor [Bacteroidales bacterium]
MANNDWKDRLGVVFSTNPDFDYEVEAPEEEPDTLPFSQQRLRVKIERAGRKGKTVTIINGFIGKTEDLKEFSTWLKTRLSTGGSIKDGEIIIQGDQREAVLSLIEQRKQQESNR